MHYDQWLTNPPEERPMVRCPVCGGSGTAEYEDGFDRCDECDGTGEVQGGDE